MGGLRKAMPFTHLAFLVGASPSPASRRSPGSGRRTGSSRSALAEGGGLGYTLLVLGLARALLTGAYTFRLYYLVFHGEPSELVLAHTAGGAEAGTARATARTARKGRSRC